MQPQWPQQFLGSSATESRNLHAKELFECVVAKALFDDIIHRSLCEMEIM